MPATASPASLDYPLLFSSPRGPRTRWIAQLYLGLAVSLTLAVIGLILAQQPHGLDPSPAKWLICALGLGVAWTAAGSSLVRARRLVVRLQLWPRSHLVVVHTPGIWSSQVSLRPITEFGTPNRPGPTPRDLFLPSRDEGALIRIRLNSGATLYFDPLAGEYPCGRQALVAFLLDRALPESVLPPAAGASPRERDRREPAGPKFPVNRVVGALETANLEAARLDILESVVERRQQQRVGKSAF